MEQDDYERLKALPDRKLYDFVTELDHSQRKWVALHLLEERRNERLTAAARSSARASWLAALIAGVSAMVALAAYFRA